MAPLRMSTEMPNEQAETGTLDGASLAYRLSDNKCGLSELDSSVISRPVVGKLVGVQCETVELTTSRVQIDENDDAGARPSLEAPRQCPVDENEAGCDEDASPKSTCRPLETMHTDVAASSESPTARRRRTERTASLTHHTRQNWTLSLMPWSSWLGKIGVIGCLWARFRRRLPCGCGDWRNFSKSGSVWESSAGMTRDSRWHSACRLRMLSRTRIDARLPCTNREV